MGAGGQNRDGQIIKNGQIIKKGIIVAAVVLTALWLALLVGNLAQRLG